MKQTLREALEIKLKVIKGRMVMLENHLEQYLKEQRLGDAAINQIKLDTLHIVYEEFSDILKTA